MSIVREYKGNDYVKSTFHDNQICMEDMEGILSFLESHSNVYLYGEGDCGKGFMQYCQICGFTKVKGFITSKNIEYFLDNYIKGEVGIILTLKSDYYPEIIPFIWGKISITDILFIRENSKKIFSRAFSMDYLKQHMWITLPLARHCNINCASCSMFAPICEREFYSLEEVKKDICEIKRIGPELKRINISGGEPLLNPEFIEIIEAIREAYSLLPIDVYTNALLADKFSEVELEHIRALDIEFLITDYDIDKECLDRVFNKFNKANIQYRVNHDGEGKIYFKKTIDFEKKVPIYEFINCQHYTFAYSVFLYKGVIYKCPLALSIKEINGFFSKNLEITEYDYMEIDRVNSESEIYDFIRLRHPMCSYCPRVSEVVPWHRSARKIEEWT